MSTPKVEVRNLTKIFGKHVYRAKELLNEDCSKSEILKQTGSTIGVNQASFTVEEGEIFVIMGLSGSGKSTLIRMINRLIEPTSGNIFIDNQDLMSLSKNELREVRRKKMSMVFQNFGLFPNRTVLRNTAYGLEVQGINKEDSNQKAAAALELVGLDGYGDQYPDQLSGGMQQRVGLARALANDPEVLLMDEAFSALDPLNRKDMQDQLLDLQENMKKTIIFITHDLNEALRIGDHIMIMRDGEIIQIGTPEDILTAPADEYVERFIEDVDRSKVLTVSNVMIRPQTLNIDKHGPRYALKQMRDAEISTLFVVNSNRELVGILDARDVVGLLKENDSNRGLREIVNTEVPTTTMDVAIADILDDISQTAIPFAVVNEKNQLKGIIIRGAVLGSLAGIDSATSE